MKNALILVISLFIINMSSAKQTEKIEYSISFSEPHTHYAEVSIKVSNIKQSSVDFQMPVWAPGSYLVREFAKSVEGFEAKSNDKQLSVEKVNKNTWTVATKGLKEVTVSYKLYAFEKSVRTSFIDIDRAFLHNTSCFMLVRQFKNSAGTLKINPYKDWKVTSTGLKMGENNTYSFANYDELADCPIEIGNHKVYKFEVMGVPHELAFVGESNCDINQFVKDLQKTCEEAANIVGEHPCERYVFFVHNVDNGGGGLEHMNSTAVQMKRFDYTKPGKYVNFLGLCAHEYFHLWNVKRIRPAELGPFDYSSENYTKLLWVAEGITNYYDELIPARAKFIDDNSFLRSLSGRMNSVDNNEGNAVQPLADASWDAWIKAYRPNENSRNTTVSYYTKGLVVAAMLDLMIIHETKGEKHLDDLMKALYQKFYKEKKRGFTDKEFVQTVNELCGSDQSQFFDDYVYDTKSIDYKKYLDYAGLGLADNNKDPKPSLGISLNGTTITSIERGGSAWTYGLNVKDEIISFNEVRVTPSNINDLLNMLAGQDIKVLISRDGLLRTLIVKVGIDKSHNYSIEKSEITSNEAAVVYNKWMSRVK
jgi:predicted metalloprotease with PDZ domain